MALLVLLFKKIESEDKAKHDNFYSNSKAEIIINENYIDDVLQSIFATIRTNIQKGSGWIIDSVIAHFISISKYNSLARSSYIKLPKELDHPRKGLINIQTINDKNIDGECFKWSIVRYLNPVYHNPRRITIPDKDFAEKFDSKDIKFPVRTRRIFKIGKNEFHRH